jgi:hypothetical protein
VPGTEEKAYIARTGGGEPAIASGFWVLSGGRYESGVPIISLFFGIVIRMYHDEHPPPHFHAAYQGFEAFVRIEDGEILHGELPRKAARLVRQWALDHRDALMANWERSEMLLPMEMIPGADADD